jgi:tetraacyldisaccharide 4'-kinase
MPVSQAGSWLDRWWRGEGGAAGVLLDLALFPAEQAFRGASWLFHAGYDRGVRRIHRAGIPVVSVGNIAVGGTGKTPFSRWLVEELRRRGARPALLHGGYAPDEPALHRAWCPDVPVLADGDRVRSAAAAERLGATVLVLDDAFQHRRLARDLDIVLVAAESWCDRPRLLPRGPWREPPSALARGGVVVITRRTATVEEAERVATAVRRFAPAAIHVRLRLRAARWVGRGGAAPAPVPGGPALAVAGIARPDLFVENAVAAGAQVAATLVVPDHHTYSPGDIARIRRAAAGRPIVTTAKDAVKLEPLAADLPLWVLEQDVVVEAGGDALMESLDRLIS